VISLRVPRDGSNFGTLKVAGFAEELRSIVPLEIGRVIVAAVAAECSRRPMKAVQESAFSMVGEEVFIVEMGDVWFLGM
jgi:hypothetical protein